MLTNGVIFSYCIYEAFQWDFNISVHKEIDFTVVCETIAEETS